MNLACQCSSPMIFVNGWLMWLQRYASLTATNAALCFSPRPLVQPLVSSPLFADLRINIVPSPGRNSKSAATAPLHRLSAYRLNPAHSPSSAEMRALFSDLSTVGVKP